MEALKMLLHLEKQDQLAKLYALAVAEGEKLDPKSLPYQEVITYLTTATNRSQSWSRNWRFSLKTM